MNWETKIPLIFWHISEHCTIKHPVSFRTQNVLVSLILKPVCQNDRLWNVPLYDVKMWLNTAFAEKDQHLLLYRCLFSPAHQFVHVVWITRETNAGLHRNQMIKMSPKTTRHCAVPSCGKTLHCLPSDPNIRKEWYFIFNEVLDRVNKNTFVYKQGIICGIFRKI